VKFGVDKVALVQIFPLELPFSFVSIIPAMLRYTEKRKKIILIVFITGLHNKSKGCGASEHLLRGPSPKQNYSVAE
jgi:hypothetical protein